MYCPTVSHAFPCPPRNYCPSGSVLPIICPAGTASAGSQAARCEPCRPGFYSGYEASLGCTECPPGTYTDAAGSTSCKLCGQGHTSGSGASSQSQCVEIPNDALQKLLGALLVYAPVIGGTILLIIGGIWLKNQRNARTWARFPGYNIAYLVKVYVFFIFYFLF